MSAEKKTKTKSKTSKANKIGNANSANKAHVAAKLAKPASAASATPTPAPTPTLPTLPIKSANAKASANTPAVRKPRKPSLKPKLHIREAPAKDSPTLCGGSHSPIWNISGDRPLESVSPQQAAKGTCGRCIRVAHAREMI